MKVSGLHGAFFMESVESVAKKKQPRIPRIITNSVVRGSLPDGGIFIGHELPRPMASRFLRSCSLLKAARRISRRVPVRNQLSEVECGAACLASILTYYGRETTVEECRALCGVGRDGVSARTIANVARDFGLLVRAYRSEPSALEHLTLPAIVHWKFNHFVVVEAWSRNRVLIVDPGCGRRRISAGEFNLAFTGVVLTFEPTWSFKPANRPGRAYWPKYVASIFSSRLARK